MRYRAHPNCRLIAAPIGDVQQSDLPPPGSAASPRNRGRSPAAPVGGRRDCAADHAPAGDVTQVAPHPGNLYVRSARSRVIQYANMQRARVAGLGAERRQHGSEWPQPMFPRHHRAVHNGAAGDEVLDQVLRAGVTDARIVVE